MIKKQKITWIRRKRTEDTPTQETVEEHRKSHVPFVNAYTSLWKCAYDDMQEQVTQGKIQLTGNVVHIESHVGDEYLEEHNEGADLADGMSHSGGLKAIETTLA